jgi:decaprenylphospho-beta-D-erythro-pentofuranosid-2-ulose 2-reductase
VKDAFGAVQSVVLMGGTSEIGLAIVRELPRQAGSTVHLLGPRQPDPLPSIAGSEVVWTTWDARGEAESAAIALGESARDIDVVVMAVGILGAASTGSDPAATAELFATNLTGPAAALVACARRLRAQRHGTVIVVSSVAGLRPRSANWVYGASKAGLDFFARGLASELVPAGIRVLVVRPGFVHGRMTAGRRPAPLATTPEAVAKVTVAALSGRRAVVYAPGSLRVVFAALRCVPSAIYARLPG